LEATALTTLLGCLCVCYKLFFVVFDLLVSFRRSSVVARRSAQMRETPEFLDPIHKTPH
jgi:hypothetical protein